MRSRILAVQLRDTCQESYSTSRISIYFLKGVGTTQLVGFKKNASILSSTR